MKKAFLFLLVFCIQLAWAQKVDDIHMGEVLIRPPKIVKENFDKDTAKGRNFRNVQSIQIN